MTAGPVIFLDIGASLIQGPAQAPARFLAAALGLDEVQRKRLDRHLLTNPILSPPDLASLLRSDYGVEPDRAMQAAEAVWETQIAGPSAIDGARELLETLQGRGYRYGFISNIWHPYAESFARLFGPLAGSDLSILSYRVGAAKPDPAIYRLALAAAGCRAGECVMIGDSYDNDIAPALGIGMRTVWLLHRPDKEAAFLGEVERRRLPGPDLLLPSVADLTAGHLDALFRR